jgi:integrase/recombinase XerC
VRRLDLPQQAPRALSERDIKRWLRTAERWPSTRDRILAQIPFYAGLRLGEIAAPHVEHSRLSARKGLIIVRSGKGEKYRQVPGHEHARQRADLTAWINDERPGRAGPAATNAMILNQRGGRLSSRGAHSSSSRN